MAFTGSSELSVGGGLDASTHTQLSKAVKTAETQGKTGKSQG